MIKKNKKSKRPQLRNPLSILIAVALFFAATYGVFLFLGGPKHLEYTMKPAPDFDSSSLRHARSEVKDRQEKAILASGQSMGAERLGSGSVDICVHGFKGGMGKSGTSYKYKCVHRTNSFYGLNGSFSDLLKRLEAQLSQDKWHADSGGVGYVLREYNTNKEKFKNVVNSLPAVGYYKDKQYLKTTYADTDPGKEDNSSPVWSRIDDSSQTIGGQIIGERIHEDENFISYSSVIQSTKEKGYQYIFMISGEEAYFMN